MSQPAVLPIVLPASIRSGLASSRIRALCLGLDWRSLRPGDLLWVQEAVTIDQRQIRPDRVWARYGGMPRALPIDWPRGQPTPAAGYLGPLDMPRQCSRFTLRVTWVHRLNIKAVPTALAVDCGVTGERGSWAPWGAPEGFVPYGRVYEALRVMFEQMGGRRGIPWPAVTVVEFECLARNIDRVLAREVAA